MAKVSLFETLMIDTLKFGFKASLKQKSFFLKSTEEFLSPIDKKKHVQTKYKRNDDVLKMTYISSDTQHFFENYMIFVGSLPKAVYGNNTTNRMVSKDRFFKLVSLLLERYKIEQESDIEVFRVDTGWNYKMNTDVRFLIPKLPNNASRLKTRRYDDQTLLLYNSQRSYRVYDKIQDNIAKKLISQKEWGNKSHNILREEISTFKKRNILKVFPNIDEIFNKRNQKEYFLKWHKKLCMPDFNKIEHFSYIEFFQENGWKDLVFYLGHKGVSEIGYKNFSDMFNQLGVPRATKYRYLKQVKEILSRFYTEV